MKNRILVSSLIIGLVGATAGIAQAQYGGRSDSGSSSSDMRPETSGTMETQRGSGAGQFIDDATVTTRVKSRFAQDDQVSAMNINVETSNGVVQLSGYAGSEAEKSRAADIAREVPNVRDVQNGIVVRGTGGSSSPGSATGSGSGSSGMGTGRMGGDSPDTSGTSR